MDCAEIVGFVGGAFATFSFAPQVWRLFRLRSAHEISLPFNLLIMTGVACWIAYGVLLSLAPVILWNAITFTLVSGMFYAKLRYGLLAKAQQ